MFLLQTSKMSISIAWPIVHWKLKTQSSMFIFVNWLLLKSKVEDICTRSNPTESFRLGGVAWGTCWGQTLHCKLQVHPGVIKLFQWVLILLRITFRAECASLKMKSRKDVEATLDGWALEGNLKDSDKQAYNNHSGGYCLDDTSFIIFSVIRSVFQWHPELKIGFGCVPVFQLVITNSTFL